MQPYSLEAKHPLPECGTAPAPATRSKAGDWVRVRSKEEILRTLDANGRLDGLPFMPQMFQYCGRKVRVFKRAHKTCDTIAGPLTGYVERKVPDGVHLEFRCDGKAYGGCQAACLIFWNEAWLERIDDASSDPSPSPSPLPPKLVRARCTEADVLRATRVAESEKMEPRYACQATELHSYSMPIKWWDARQYIEDYRSGNTTIKQMLRTLIYAVFYFGSLANRHRLGRPARWLYGACMKAVGGSPMRRTRGNIPLDKLTPRTDLNLVPGDLVRVKSFEAILDTVNKNNSNRGLTFDAEMVMFCGNTYRVRTRVEKFIDEGSGRMKTLKTPAVILDGAYCRACYSDQRFFCPRSIFAWWREVWLEKVDEGTVQRGNHEHPASLERDVQRLRA
jgi:hypothetical protein